MDARPRLLPSLALGLAVAAAGQAEYDGIAANAGHKDWFDHITDL